MGLSAAEQYLLELINRARLNPQAEADRYGITLNSGLQSGTIDGSAKQVLAANGTLETAAARHSEWMLRADSFSHTGVGGSSPGQRMADAGYAFTGNWTWRENLAWTGSTGSINLSRAIEQHHEGLYRSAGHRSNTFAEDIREVGLAQVEGKFSYQGNTYNASMLTEKFAKSGSDVFVTGVAYKDNDGDKFYSIGEGQSGYTFTVGSRSDATEGAGGYAVKTGKDADARVTISKNGSTQAVLEIDTSDGNAKVDLVTKSNGSKVLEVSTTADLVSGVHNARLLGIADGDLTGTGSGNSLRGNDGDNTLRGKAGGDTLTGQKGHDKLIGNKGFDKLYGNHGWDELSGNRGNDKLWGGKGNDKLWGGKGHDKMWGGSGNDMLDGARGNDKMTGGGGADTFVFRAGDDVIRDFKNDVDTIAIDGDLLGGNASKAAALDAARVVSGDVVFDFDGGHSLTLRNIDDINILSNDLTIV